MHIILEWMRYLLYLLAASERDEKLMYIIQN